MANSNSTATGALPSIVDQVMDDPLLLDNGSVREQVRLLPIQDYNRLWDLYIHAKGRKPSNAKADGG